MTTTSDELQCALCGDATVSTTWADDDMVWGSGDSAIVLPVHLPFRSCSACDFTYLDHEAEDIRHQAVCRHLGVPAPADVLAIREKHGLSQAEFARAVGLQPDMVERWESGIVIPDFVIEPDALCRAVSAQMRAGT